MFVRHLCVPGGGWLSPGGGGPGVEEACHGQPPGQRGRAGRGEGPAVEGREHDEPIEAKRKKTIEKKGGGGSVVRRGFYFVSCSL